MARFPSIKRNEDVLLQLHSEGAVGLSAGSRSTAEREKCVLERRGRVGAGADVRLEKGGRERVVRAGLRLGVSWPLGSGMVEGGGGWRELMQGRGALSSMPKGCIGGLRR